MSFLAGAALGKVLGGAAILGTGLKIAAAEKQAKADGQAVTDQANAMRDSALALRDSATQVRFQATEAIDAAARLDDEGDAQRANADAAVLDALTVRRQYADMERLQRIEADKSIAKTRVRYAASGLMFDGSALDVLEEAAAAAELDAQNIRQEGLARARAFDLAAEQARRRELSARRSALGTRGQASLIFERADGIDARAGKIDEQATQLAGRAGSTRRLSRMLGVGNALVSGAEGFVQASRAYKRG